MKIRKRKNPELENIAKEILSNVKDWEYLDEGQIAEVYYFLIDFPLEINNIILNPGEYVLKIEKKKKLKDIQINYLKTLSSYKLIPKIYYIDELIIIKKYIEGKTIRELLISGVPKIIKKIITNNLEKIIEEWHYYGFAHGDINKGNIIVDKKFNVHLIDPSIDIAWIVSPPMIGDLSKIRTIWKT